MNNFKQFYELCLEAKANAGVKLHLSHLEDLVIEGGKQGFADFTAQIVSFKNYIYGLDSETVVNLKVDGAPALYFGADPRPHYKGQFFVASKSGFNKNPKINHTPEEIQQNHGHAPGLAQKLNQAYNALRPVYDALNTDRIFQGDIIFTDDLKHTEDIDGQQHITFQPQLIKYAVPVDSESELYNRVNAADFGIAIHDSFQGVTDDGVNVRFTNPSKNNQEIVHQGKQQGVFIEPSTYGRDQINLDIPRDFKVNIDNLLKQGQGHIDQISDEFDALYTSNSKFMGIVQRFINDEVKKSDRGVKNVYTQAFDGDSFDDSIFTKRFNKFVMNNYESEIKGKGARGVENAKQRLAAYKNIFENESFQHFMVATHFMITIKRIILNLFDQVEQSIQKTGGKIGKTFMPQGDGSFTLGRGEGFVLFVGDNQVKIVDRLDFSQKNLTSGRFQTQEK